MKKKYIIIILIIFVVCIIGYGTYSLFTGNISLNNIIKTGNVDLEVIENKDENNFIIKPGDILDKTISIKNTGKHPIYVRAKVIITVDNKELTSGEINVNVDNTKWIYSNGYYYYSKALNSNAVSENLFTKIYIDIFKIDNSYSGKKFNIRVLAQGVQSENNGDDPIEAFGWPNE